jgi:hypothetical protein
MQCPLLIPLCTDQYDIVRVFKKRYLTTATGKPLFSTQQLANLTLLLPAPTNDVTLSPQCLNPDQTQTQETETPDITDKEVSHQVPREVEKCNVQSGGKTT